MRAGDKILHVMVQTNHNNGGAPGLGNGRMAAPAMAAAHTMPAANGMDHANMAAAAAVLAAAAGQPVLGAGHADWQLLPQHAGGMMW